MHEADDAIAEIDYCFDTLRFAGVCLFASYGEKFLGDPLFDPVLAALNARDAIVFVHPAYHPSSRGLDLPWPGFMMEYLFDTTRAAVNLLLSGALDRFPRIRFILAHAGGVLPYFAWRLSVAPMIDPRLPQWPREKIMAGLAATGTTSRSRRAPQTMAALDVVAAPERILFGSDWPFANARVVAEMMKTHNAPEFIPRRSARRSTATTLSRFFRNLPRAGRARQSVPLIRLKAPLHLVATKSAARG